MWVWVCGGVGVWGVGGWESGVDVCGGWVGVDVCGGWVGVDVCGGGM